jgi:hypothetical protein
MRSSIDRVVTNVDRLSDRTLVKLVKDSTPTAPEPTPPAPQANPAETPADYSPWFKSNSSSKTDPTTTLRTEPNPDRREAWDLSPRF